MQKDNNIPKKKQYPDKDTKCTCTSPCRECVLRHTCPDVCLVFKKAIQA